MRGLGAALMAAALLAALGLAQSGQAATSTKYYGMTAIPASVPGGTTTTIALTLMNCGGPGTCSPASSQTLGSVNVTPATGFTIAVPTGASTPVSAAGEHWTAQVVSNVLQLRAATSGDALPPGDTLQVRLSVTAPCAAPASTTWTTVAKQSNSFNGPPGNDFVWALPFPLGVGVDTTTGGPLHHFGVALPATTFTATAGVAFTPTITALDSCNRPVTTYAGTPTIGGLGQAPNGALPTYGSATFSGGTASPSITAVKAASNAQLTVADGSAAGSSTPFQVVAGPPASLAFTSQPPANLQKNSTFGTTVTAYDTYGNVATGTGAVSLQLVPPASQLLGGVSSSLLGTTSLVPTGGVAAFTGLAVDTSGSGYTLGASYPGATSATSAPFDVFDVYGTCPRTGCEASDTSIDVNVQPPGNLTGPTGLSINGAATTTCDALSQLGSLFIVEPPAGDTSFGITVTLTIGNFFLNGIGVSHIVVCKSPAGSTTLLPLPDCPKKGQPTQACVVSRTSSNAGDAIITLRIDSTDPIGAGFG